MKFKTLIILYVFVTILFIGCMGKSYACQIQVPTSEARRYIDAMPNGVPPLYSCADKPEEKCHCADEVAWDHAELVDDVAYEEGVAIHEPKLVNSEAKKAANEAKKQAEKELELSKIAAKKALKLSIKDEIKTATTVAKLRALIEKMIEAQE